MNQSSWLRAALAPAGETAKPRSLELGAREPCASGARAFNVPAGARQGAKRELWAAAGQGWSLGSRVSGAQAQGFGRCPHWLSWRLAWKESPAPRSRALPSLGAGFRSARLARALGVPQMYTSGQYLSGRGRLQTRQSPRCLTGRASGSRRCHTFGPSDVRPSPLPARPNIDPLSLSP